MNAETIARAIGGKRAGRGWSAKCPAHDDVSPSLSISDAGDGKILVHCHAGCDQRQVIAALQARGLWAAGGYNFPSAGTSRRREGLIDPTLSRGQDNFPTSGRSDHWKTIWHETVAAPGTPVETYLASRGLRLPHDAPLRFHPTCPRRSERLPAMVALMTDPVTTESCGLHRTYLRPDGAGKVESGETKMMLGAGGVIRLARDEDVTGGLGICEGIETGLAITQHAGWRPIWAAGNAGNIGRFPVLPGIETLTVFADCDDKGAGLQAAHECARRWYAAGREVVIQQPPAGTDWHDALARAA